MNNDQDEYILIWDAPKLEKPEFRLYYDDKGQVITYTCEKLEGNYIVIDSQTFAECRPDVRVLNGKIVHTSSQSVVSKLVPNNTTGTNCAADDLSIVVTKNAKLKTTKWKLETYELS